MIESISIQGVASFQNPTPVSLNTNKKIVLFYGHNGTGKSTVARYLQDTTHNNYSNCSYVLPNSQDYQILVYNTDFVEKNFSQDSFEGVFTLGETNVTAEQAISTAEAEIVKLEEQRTQKQILIDQHKDKKTTQDKAIKDKCFEIKKKHDKKDLDHCLVGFKGSASTFYYELLKTDLIETPEYTFESLATESKELNNKSAVPKSMIPNVVLDLASSESNTILNEVIVGSSDSYLAELVDKLQNSTWVDNGRVYIGDAEGKCPFCQQAIDDELTTNINNLFDVSYEEKKDKLKTLQSGYKQAIKTLNETLSGTHYTTLNDTKFDLAKEKLSGVLQVNLTKLNQKLADPSIKITLEYTTDLVQKINDIINIHNASRQTFNGRLSKKKESLTVIKKKFWSLIRIKYDAAIKAHDTLIEIIDTDIEMTTTEENTLTTAIQSQNEIIAENRDKITNIQTSVININNQIKSIGLEGFEIKPKLGNSNHYYLCRGTSSSGNDVYKSLSEGEKTLITYLYFLELCQGSVDSNSSTPDNKKIIVVDDPISSLSHNYIYEIGSLTHKKLIKGYKYAQVILLTHSLYYLHEVIKYLPRGKDATGNDKFDNKCNLFRVLKNTNSSIVSMGRDDIKNDYQSYWQIIKDAQSGSTNNIVLPNIMRNILEYYFSFVHKTDVLKVELDKLEEDDDDFSPFFRFINRESHSDSINITDLGEIDSDRFITKFKEVFVKTDFEEHYDKMMT
ncbi:AAA family ATPase [Pseudoalteromonas sp. TB64]|uniref:AAA family ATPase n=1 Tax=Pseudoalteromonas sp. TB64 TaxID=1938600 RepID=UPI00041CAD62|nr:AAA family ATPase [Pseudoalteromonas sp. TB64]